MELLILESAVEAIQSYVFAVLRIFVNFPKFIIWEKCLQNPNGDETRSATTLHLRHLTRYIYYEAHFYYKVLHANK